MPQPAGDAAKCQKPGTNEFCLSHLISVKQKTKFEEETFLSLLAIFFNLKF